MLATQLTEQSGQVLDDEFGTAALGNHSWVLADVPKEEAAPFALDVAGYAGRNSHEYLWIIDGTLTRPSMVHLPWLSRPHFRPAYNAAGWDVVLPVAITANGR